jgi:triacylglycerol lipase
LTLNVVRPAGVKPGDRLPVGVWVHGGVSSHPLAS